MSFVGGNVLKLCKSMSTHPVGRALSLRSGRIGLDSSRPWLSRTLKTTSVESKKSPPSEVLPPLNNPPEPYKGVPVMVKAYYLSRSVDILRVHGSQAYVDKKRDFHKKSLTVTIDGSNNQYISIFAYGSVVLFNIPPQDHSEHLRMIRDAAVTSPIAEGLQHTDTFKVVIHAQLDRPSAIKATHVNVRALDSKNIQIVGAVMAQTVSLDYYADRVDKMLESFMKINNKIEETGNFDALETKGLYRLVASNNTVITNVLSKLGIFEGGPDATWENSDYHHTWEMLRKDFELDNRFKDLSLKLDIVKDNAQLFLEILQNRNSNRLEWMIIALISGELAIGCFQFYLAYYG